MNIIQKVFVEPFQKCYENMLYFIPNLLTFIMLLIAGIVIGYIIKIIFSRVLKAVKLDKFAERSGIFEVMSKGGVKEPPSIIVAKLIGWLTVLTFIVIAFQALKIPTVEHLLERFFLYLPNIFVAVVILMVGYLLSNFFGRAALIALVNAGTKNAGMISKFIRFTVFVFSATMALEQLGIGRDTVIIAFTIIFGGVVLAGAIACGLGGKDIARNYFEKKMKEDDKEDEIHHL